MKRILICTCLFVGAVAGLQQVLADDSTSLLPLGRSWAGSQNLPLPYGLGADYYYQRQGYDITRMSLGMPPTALAQLPPAAAMALGNPDLGSQLQVRTRINEGDVKLDAWLLPFLNVFILDGYVGERTTVTGVPVLNNLQINENGNIYGGGLTLAGSIDRFWASLMAAVTYADLSGEDSWIRAWVVSPKVGVQLDTPWSEKALNVWVGAMYQAVDEDHSGTFNTELGPVMYNVKLKEEQPWNFLVGANLSLSQHWQASAEVGLGQRQQAMGSLTYRF